MVSATVFGRLLNDLKIGGGPCSDGCQGTSRSTVALAVSSVRSGSWGSDDGIDCELAEQTLTHAAGSRVELYYSRSDVLEAGARSWRPGASWLCK